MKIAAALAGALVTAAWLEPATARAAEGDDVFGLTRLHQVELTIAADDYDKMDPPPTVGFFGGRPPVPGEHAGAGNMNYEFEYVPADVHIDGQAYPRVGLRYKGSGTYLASQFRAKRSFKIDFDRHDAAQRFHGLAKLNLNSGVMDPTKVRESLAYAVFRAAGVPAPRTALAEVVLHVPGRRDREYLGLYTVVEQVDEQFLAARFSSGAGLLLKPEGIRGLPYLGDDVANYAPAYNAKSQGSPADWARLVELTRLINEANEDEFRREIGNYLDVDGFVRFVAANAMLASLDGFLGMGHNYYLYLAPETGKFSFIPWDLDLAFGGFAMYGSPEQTANLSVDHPFVAENKLIERLLAMPEAKTAYLDATRRLLSEVFTPEKLGADYAAVTAIAEEPLANEAAGVRKRGESTSAGMFSGLTESLPMAEFIAKRAKSVAGQLAGTTEGYVPRARGFGFGPPPGASEDRR
jgi:hypothetical protein